MEKQPAFHLAFLVNDLEDAADFYCRVLGGRRGRDAPNWVDVDLHGHQLSLHKGENLTPIQGYSEVDGHPVPMPHFGVVLSFARWEALVERICQHQWPFLLKPRERFAGQPAEQGTFFVQDPSGNTLEFKGLRELHRIFEV
ncbi:VOC family protein [Alcanivorax borkumensis]|jgi:extradiol dioxygenase family protein|uniref:VOC family protein n=1 Tax=Alcanivorax borkumensis TaxID=59754 RepID=UPI003EEDBAA2